LSKRFLDFARNDKGENVGAAKNLDYPPM
jgi:hypothetical protein